MKYLSKSVFLLLLLLVFKSDSKAQISLLQNFQNTSSAPIGTFLGVSFREAGFSGLYPIPGTNGTEFWTMSDRGVNIDCANANISTCRPTYDKMYAFPTYAPKIHRIRLVGSSVQIIQTITIKRPNGTGATGLINPTGLGSTASELASTDTVQNCANFLLKTTLKDTFGIDPEGIVVDKNGNFWLCDEGGATIWKVNSSGVLLTRYTPYANLAGVQSVDMQIDTCFKYRRNNRGFEGIAITPNGKIYAAIQSPLYYPNSSNNGRVHRIIEIDPVTNMQRMFVYLNDGIIGTGANQIRFQDWKIGDMAAINDSTFLVLDAAARGTSDIKRLYTININQATVVNSGLYGGTTTVEGLIDSAGLAAYGIKAVKKTLVMDLLANGWPAALDKAEGIAILNDSTIAISNDNDFGQTCPLANGIPIATGNNSHVITYRLSGANKLENFKIAATNFTLQILHASDMESGIDAPIDAPNFAAVLDTLEGTYLNTVKLASGDCFIPSPFLAAGEDPSMQTPLRNTASFYYGGTQAIRAAIGRTDVAMMNIMGFQGSAFGNHEFDLGTPEVNSIIGVDIRSNGADKRWIGAQFPYLSANLNFANDINLSYLTTNQRLLVDSFKTSPTITANAQKKGIAPSAIIQLNGDRVGIVGATTQLLASISSPGATTVLGGSSDNMPALAAVLQPVIDSLRAMGINKIILMSHLQQLANEKALAPLLKGVDIIIAGGSHSLCADGNDRIRPGTPVADKYPILTLNNDNEPLAILNTTSEWKYVGRFVCDFDSLGRLLPNTLDSTINGAYAADTAMVTSLWGNYSSAFAPGTKGGAVRTLTTAIASVINSKDGNKFGKTNVFLEGRRNFVRTEETNFGDLSADANLWYARQYDNQVKVSIKNGGGIRSAIGNVNAVGSTTILEKTSANPSAGKESGDISQLDIENSLRFNNGLSILRTNAAGLKRLLEHGISATIPGATPGQFPQVGGVAFSYDTTKAVGNRIQSLVIIDSLGNKIDTIAKEGKLVGDTSRTYKIVTLDFLANGGDNYPFPANTNFRVNLDTAIKVPGVATFTTIGKEQDAFAEYMATRFTANPYNVRDTSIRGDFRIQLLNARQEGLIVPNSGPSSSKSPYLLPAAPGVRTTAILTAGDKVGNYMMAGLADGTGAYDNGNGTFTFLVSHELGNTLGVNRAHGAKGAFVSKWVINKSDLSVVSGSDLIQKVNIWNGTGYTLYNPADTTSKKAFNRFCSSDLSAVSAFYNAATGLGTQERIFMNGEESGPEGRAFGHIVTGTNAGTTYELPYLGKFSWENSIASPVAQNKTIVVGTDDATPGQVYFYIGTKTNTGTEIEKAGLSNGRLYGVAVAGLLTENSATVPGVNTSFSLIDLGIVRDSSGAALNAKSNALGVTNFLRPEDGHWDPSNPNDFYFVTTNSFTAPSRLWRLRMSDIKTPELGGTITAVLDGTEGPKMMDNMTIDNYGNVLIQEDPGNQTHLAKIWQYNISTDQVKLISTHDSTRFVVGGANYLTQDEESSGIIDMQSILGAGMFLMVDQAHYGVGGEQVEGGQILSLYNPDTYNASKGANPSSSQSPYLLPAAPGVRTTAILTAGDKIGNYMMAGTPDGTGAYDNGNGTFTFLVSHEFGNTLGVNRAHGAKGAFVSKWVINKSDLSVLSGSDLIQKVNLWNGTGYTLYNPADTTSKKAFNRFCSSDLPAVNAFYNATTGLGTQERIFMNGEESGPEGRAFGHIVTGVNAGTTYELPYLGKFSWENSVASPVAQNKTIVVGTDDATPGQVYFYIGTKTNTGTEIEKAGLSNGRLYGVAVAGLATEISTSIPAANTAFTMVDLGIVRDSSGAALNAKSNALGVTNFLRPEDGHWDPSNPNDFYFVTTNSFTAPSRLWRLRMSDIKTPELGGTITAVLDGTEGPKMMDNMTIDNFGNILIQEDPGNQSYLARIWQYNIATDAVKVIAVHDSTRFVTGVPNFLTQDEESSGIIDMQSILGAGMFLMVDQAHFGVGGEQVEGGQILSLYNPDTYNANPEINVKANNVNIPNGLTTPNTNTQFGIAATGSSETKTFIVENTAIGNLTIKSIAITGANASEFSIVIPSTTPAIVNGNSTLSVIVKFTPKASGNRNATLVLNSNDFDEPTYSFAIQGTGVCTSPIVSVTYVGSNSFCAGDSLVLNASNSSTFSYQWSKSGVAINGANASKYTAKETGNFTVMVTDTFACSANSSAVGVIANPIPAKPSISRSGDVLTSSLESNYQWYLNGGIINGATARNYTATTKGSYTVKVTNAAGCASVLSDSLSFIPTGLNLYQAINQVSIAPNPYTDFTNIQLGLNSNSFVRIEVVSTLGVLVEVLEEKQLSAGNHTYTFGAKEHGFAAGMYLVRITVDGETVVKRIVENK